MSDLRVGAPSASLRPGGGWGTGCRAAGSPRSERRPGVDPAAGRGDVDGRIWAPGGCERGRADDRRGWWDPSGRRTEGTDRVLNCLEAEPFDSGGGGREGGREDGVATHCCSPEPGLGPGAGGWARWTGWSRVRARLRSFPLLPSDPCDRVERRELGLGTPERRGSAYSLPPGL